MGERAYLPGFARLQERNNPAANTARTALSRTFKPGTADSLGPKKMPSAPGATNRPTELAGRLLCKRASRPPPT